MVLLFCADDKPQILRLVVCKTVYNGYVKSAIAHLWFVCIHPFDDGNGRIGRAIADMALSQAENSKMRFFSISHQINKDKNSITIYWKNAKGRLRDYGMDYLVS